MREKMLHARKKIQEKLRVWKREKSYMLGRKYQRVTREKMSREATRADSW